MISRWNAAGCFAMAALSLAMALGCGDGRPKRVPVSGQVLIDGKPLTTGAVRLIPRGARPSVGQLDEQGRFQLTCFESDDGSVEGEHRVAVVAVEPINDRARRWHAPKKYANPATSGLTTTINGETDDLVIELTWSGGKPFVERTMGE